MLISRDDAERRMYRSIDELATELRVQQIIEVPFMRPDAYVMGPVRVKPGGGSASTFSTVGIIVNPMDYTIGADRGGAVAFFDDFDIDYNQQKYLIETRVSGALVVPESAVVLDFVEI